MGGKELKGIYLIKERCVDVRHNTGSSLHQGKAGSRTPEEAKSITSPPEGGGSGSEEEEEEEEDPSVDPAASRQPQPREETSV